MNEFTDIGNDLIDYAEHTAEFTAKRGLLGELFPFVYVASRRMSLRAICRWLEDTKNIKISATAISKAMRNQDAYWKAWADEICPTARTFADAHCKAPLSILDNEEYFEHLTGEPLHLVGRTDEELSNETGYVKDAEFALRDRWYNTPKEARVQCWRYIAADLEPNSKGQPDVKQSERKSNSEHGKQPRGRQSAHAG